MADDGTVPGEVLLPGWNQCGPYDLSHRLSVRWPAARPPQVGESVEVRPGGYGDARDVRTVEAVAWTLYPVATRGGSGLPEHVAGLVVEVGERSPFPC